MDPDYTNTNLKPTEVTDYPYLFCCDEDIRSKYSNVDSWGKWMMFFHKDKLDEKWMAACELYRQRKLTGIASMKVSTALDNDRASDRNTGVIVFYCGPPQDRAAMMEYGKNLLQQFPYTTKFGHMYYKSDEQTALGTRATGRKNNSLYKIWVPSDGVGEYDDGDDDYGGRRWRRNSWWNRPGAGVGDSDEDEEEKGGPSVPAFVEMDPACTNKDLKPSEVTTYQYLFRVDEHVRSRYSHIKAWGKWLMFFPKEELDEKWAEACDLYNAGRLPGIAYMKVSTAYDSDRSSDKNTGVIAFYCGPAGNRIAMLETGNDLLDQFPYENDFGYMYYKSEEQTARGTRATGREKNSLYKIAVPKKAARGISGAGSSSRARNAARGHSVAETSIVSGAGKELEAKKEQGKVQSSAEIGSKKQKIG